MAPKHGKHYFHLNSAGIALCPPLGYLGLHKHTHPELYYVLSGEGIVEIEGENYQLEKGMTVLIPGNAEHGVRNEGVDDFKWLYIFPGQFEDVEYMLRAEGAYGTKSEIGVKANCDKQVGELASVIVSY